MIYNAYTVENAGQQTFSNISSISPLYKKKKIFKHVLFIYFGQRPKSGINGQR